MKAVLKNLILMLLLTAGISVFGQTETALEVQRQAYNRNLKRWNSFTEKQRQEIRKKAATVKPEKLPTLRGKLKALNSLPQENRALIEKNYSRFKVLDHEERIMLRKRHQRLLRMSEEERLELRGRLNAVEEPEPVVVPASEVEPIIIKGSIDPVRPPLPPPAKVRKNRPPNPPRHPGPAPLPR